MSSRPGRSRAVARSAVAGVGAAALLLSLAAPALAAGAPVPRPLAGPNSGDFPGAQVPLGSKDVRGTDLVPTAAAQAAIDALGARLSVSWTQYGTPRTLVRDGGWLASGFSGDAVTVARAFLSRNAALFGMSATDVADLEMWRDETLQSSDAHAVLFRQHASGKPYINDGLISVAVKGGDIAGVTSSAVPTSTLSTTAPVLSAAQAVVAAVKDAGLAVTPADLTELTGRVDPSGFTRFAATGLAQTQLTKLAVLPVVGGKARLVWQVEVTDVAGLRATAAESFVDAVTGEVLLRRDAVNTLAEGTAAQDATRSLNRVGSVQATMPGTFMALSAAKGCGPRVALAVPTATVTLAVTANGVNPANDLVLKVHRRTALKDDIIISEDTGVNSEAGTATLVPVSTAADTFEVEICHTPTTVTTMTDEDFLAPFTVAGGFLASDAAAPGPGGVGTPSIGVESSISAPSTYRFFQANPVLGLATVGLPAADNRSTGCGGLAGQPGSITKTTQGCEFFFNTPENPTVYDTQNGAPTFATIGNNAVTTNAQASSSLTPGAPATPFQSPTRDYAPAFTDQWKATKCDPTSITSVGRADVEASTVNLFTGHNRIHDFAFRLGLNDTTGSLQTTNATDDGTPGDPELGNVQNAAATNEAVVVANGPAGNAIPVTGRNNANQITQADGVPGITNQYLFQPQLGFYGPCADGDLDSSIFLHEYTHAISNRLIAGPVTGLSGQQGGSMGESWSDLDAVEFLNAFGVAGKGGEDRYSVGAYATGDRVRGIRDYNLLDNPLTYGEFGFDTTGPEVHADGEIWNGIQMHVRQALIGAYDAKGIQESNTALQLACALGVDATGKPAPSFDGCPGNRRWITYLYDAMILQANGQPTFVDMKNATLMSVMMRNSGGPASEDYRTVAGAFAQRGLGTDSSAENSADTFPVPGFASPVDADDATVTFSVVDADTEEPVEASVYVGTYTARATPLVTVTGRASATSPTAGPSPAAVGTTTAKATMTAGDYLFAVQAPGYGITRSTATYTGGSTTATVLKVSKNLASVTSGAVPEAGPNRPADLFDDSEATNAGFSGSPAAGKTYGVKLAGDTAVAVQVFNVSAMHHPVSTEAGDFQGRITDLRAFDLQVSEDDGATYRTVFSSPADFFPARRPRTLAPDVSLRSVTLAAPVMADHVRMVVRTNQCTGAPDFATDQDNDPLNDAACPPSENANQVNAAELQVFGPSALTLVQAGPNTDVPDVPLPVLLPLAGLTALAALGAIRRRRSRGGLAL